MISVKEAISLVLEKAKPIVLTEEISIQDALHRILAEDVFAAMDLPPFDQAAMDGFGLSQDYPHAFDATLIGEVKAGDNVLTDVQAGETIRIFTGAKIPKSITVVVAQENTRVENAKQEKTSEETTKQENTRQEDIKTEELHLEGEETFDKKIHFLKDRTFANGSNIRPKGSHIAKNQKVSTKDTSIGPAQIGLFASLGISKVVVFKEIKIALVATGDELILPGESLPEGKIYESNAWMLSAILREKGVKHIDIHRCKDQFDDLRTLFACLKNQYDVILTSGGISVGKYDLTKSSLDVLGLETFFYKVAQKPGKPLLFGQLDKTLIWCLPGNPASCWVCTYAYVLQGLHQLSRGQIQKPLWKTFPLAQNFKKKNGLTLFLKAYLNAEQELVPFSEGQESYRIDAFMEAQYLMVVSEEIEIVQAKCWVEVICL